MGPTLDANGKTEPMSRSQLEFTPKQDAEFRQFVAKQRIAAIAIAALVLFKAASTLPGLPFLNWQVIMFGVASFAAACYSCCALYVSSSRLYKITQTSGNDIGYLFSGLRSLENCLASLALAILFSIIPVYLAA
ncbi:MAG: hypothetical protein VKL23_02185 [Cyanobacteriota bacterium]|jgi:hypothetical protein|nr:hypothetical protein [Cyanobacteriota bacterium]